MLQVSRSGYYDWRQRPVDTERLQLRIRVRELYNQSRGAIGSRTLSHLLTNEGRPVGRWKARRLMQECGLQSRQPGAHRYRPAGEDSLASPNLLRQCFAPACPNTQWCGDITYIRTKVGWSYLAVVTDLFSRRVVGMAIASSPDAELICRALNNALETRHIEGRLVFHSDQGSQYRSKKFRRLLWQHKTTACKSCHRPAISHPSVCFCPKTPISPDALLNLSWPPDNPLMSRKIPAPNHHKDRSSPFLIEPFQGIFGGNPAAE